MTGFFQQATKFLVSSHGSSVWPLLVVPVLVYALSRPILGIINRMSPRSPFSERLAFWIAVAPGLAFMGLAPFTLKAVDFPMALGSWSCLIHCYGLAGIFLLVPIRAAVIFYRQYRATSRLLALTEDPSPRLAALQYELNIPIRELPTDEPTCFLTGVFHTIVCVSRGALAKLSNDELRAALFHERAHRRRRETLRASVAMYLNECSILPVRAALDQYRRCAEFIADQEALKHAHPVALASALLAFASVPLNSALTVNLAGQNVTDRVSLLLEAEPVKREGFLDKPCAVALLTAATSLAFVPCGISAVAHLLCGSSR